MELHGASRKQLITILHTDPLHGLSSESVLKNRTLYDSTAALEKHSMVPLLQIVARRFVLYGFLLSGFFVFIAASSLYDFLWISAAIFSILVLRVVHELWIYKKNATVQRDDFSQCTVIREGNSCVVNSTELVVGDLIVFTAGQRAPVDARIVQSNGLHIYEAFLTGVHHAVAKFPDDLDDDTPLRERTNMVFEGTYIHAGSGTAIVIAIGAHTVRRACLAREHAQQRRTENVMNEWLELCRAIPMIAGSLLIWYANYPDDVRYAQTMAVAALILYEIASAWFLNSQWTIISGIRLIIASSGFFGALWALLYQPSVQSFFRTTSLSTHDFIIIGWTIVPVLIMQIFLQKIVFFLIKQEQAVYRTNAGLFR